MHRILLRLERILDQKAGPKSLKYTLIGALAGAFIYCLILIILIYLLNDTIDTASDMKNFGIVPVTSILTVSHWDRMRMALNMEKQNLD